MLVVNHIFGDFYAGMLMIFSKFSTSMWSALLRWPKHSCPCWRAAPKKPLSTSAQMQLAWHWCTPWYTPKMAWMLERDWAIRHPSVHWTCVGCLPRICIGTYSYRCMPEKVFWVSSVSKFCSCAHFAIAASCHGGKSLMHGLWMPVVGHHVMWEMRLIPYWCKQRITYAYMGYPAFCLTTNCAAFLATCIMWAASSCGQTDDCPDTEFVMFSLHQGCPRTHIALSCRDCNPGEWLTRWWLCNSEPAPRLCEHTDGSGRQASYRWHADNGKYMLHDGTDMPW